MRVSWEINGIAAMLAVISVAGPAPSRAQSVEDLQHMSIGDLGRIDVSSVTKTNQALSEAPAAIYVITHEDAVRSGATSLAEILRLAPNLQVAQTSAGHYMITARGFSGSAAAQNFSNKLLVLIDGRTVYSPLFSGVYWDMQDVLPEDIDRIEVISGPGATLWGANAVNGVINIITRKSGDTQGGVFTAGAGNQARNGAIRYGGHIAPDLSYRIYASTLYNRDTLTATGVTAHDNGYKHQGGFRMDWTPSSADTYTLQGDIYRGADAQAGAPDEHIAGANLLSRWNHAWENGSAVQVQAYYDRAERWTDGAGRFLVNTFDLDVQHSFSWGPRNDIVWGGGVRAAPYSIRGAGGLAFSPSRRNLALYNLFAQDSIALNSATKLILGLKLEDDPYVGVTALPSGRLSFTVNKSTLLWASASRAIRSPTPFDRDVVESIGSTVFLIGAPDFQPEKLTAYEVGARLEPMDRMSFSVSAFYNVYDDLRTIEPAPAGFLPLRWGNMMQGHTAGVEAWGDYRVAPWWRLSAAFNLLNEHLTFAPGASGILGVAQAGDDPKAQASLKSSMNLGPDVTLDAALRYVGALPSPAVPSYVELNTRIGWNLSERVQLSVSGFNLLHDHHQEFPAPQANAVPRSFYAAVRLKF